MLGPFERFFRDLAPFVPGRIHAKLFEGEQVGSCGHDAARNGKSGNVDAGHADQDGRHAFVAAGNVDAAVKRGGAGLDLDQIGDHFARRQRVVDAVGALAFAIAHIGGKIAGAFAAGPGASERRCLYELVEVDASGIRIAKCALNVDLGLFEIFDGPARPDPERVELWRDLTHLLRDEGIVFHIFFLSSINVLWRPWPDTISGTRP